MSTTRSSYAASHGISGTLRPSTTGYGRGVLAAGAEDELGHQARRVIYREGNRPINKFVRAIGLGRGRC